MRKEGLDPPYPYGYQILSLARLPVPPLSRRCQTNILNSQLPTLTTSNSQLPRFNPEFDQCGTPGHQVGSWGWKLGVLEVPNTLRLDELDATIPSVNGHSPAHGLFPRAVRALAAGVRPCTTHVQRRRAARHPRSEYRTPAHDCEPRAQRKRHLPGMHAARLWRVCLVRVGSPSGVCMPEL